MAVKGYIKIDQSLCKGCQLCLFFCPKSLISLAHEVNAAGYEPAIFSEEGGCTGCGTCALVCPEVAIEVYRE